MDWLKELRKQNYLTAIACILIGAFLVIWPQVTIRTISWVLAILLLVFGIMQIVRYCMGYRVYDESRYELVIGLFLSIVAIYFLFEIDLLASIIYTLLGFAVVLDGLMKLHHALFWRQAGYAKWHLLVLIAVLVILLGIIVLLNPFKSAIAFMIMTGISLLVGGICTFVITFLTRK